MLIGLIGAPNQGKSTLFNALTMADAEVASHAFTTIKPNEGVAYVKVKSLRTDENPNKGYLRGGYRFIPIKIIDVAGLVPGASKGRGLGNQFMNDLSTADALIIVIDISGETDNEGNQVKDFNPSKIVETILNELDEWVYSVVNKHWEQVSKKKNPERLLAEKLSGLGIKLKHVEQSINLLPDIKSFSRKLRELSKPFVIAANKLDKSGDWKSLKEFGMVVPTSAVIELMLRKADSEGFINYLPGEQSFKKLKELTIEQERGLNYASNFLKKQSTGVQKLINTVIFELLKLKTVYPVQNEHKWTDAKGNVLPDAYLLEEKATAIDLAYKVHEEIGKGFIKAIDCKNHKVLGKNYKLKNNDVIKIITK